MPAVDGPEYVDRLKYLHQLQRRAAPPPPDDTLERELAFIQRLQIEDKVAGGLVDFRLWDFQQKFIRILREHDRVFVLKSRQLGMTWSCLAHLLHLGMAGGNRLFLIASQSGSDAIDALHRLRILYNSIPNPAVSLVTDNTEQIALANGSRFESMMATKRAGRGKAAFATFADEIAFWSYPEEQITALDSASQRLYAVTTGAGPGDLAHTIWDQAQQGLGRFHAVFYPWSVHPDRDEAWHVANVTEAPEPRLARREHAATPEDAFAAPGGVFFERFSSDRHTPQGDEDLAIVPSWQTYRGADFGWHHAAALWAQVAPSGQVFIVDELLPEHLTTQEFAKAIAEHERDWVLGTPPSVTFCDPAGKQMNVQTAVTEFEVFRDAGLNPRGKPVGRRDGAVLIMDMLAEPKLPLVIAKRCRGLLAAISQVKPHKTRPDCYDFEHRVFAHPLDALKYMLGNLGHAPAEGSVSAKRAKRDRSGF